MVQAERKFDTIDECMERELSDGCTRGDAVKSVRNKRTAVGEPDASDGMIMAQIESRLSSLQNSPSMAHRNHTSTRTILLISSTGIISTRTSWLRLLFVRRI